MQKLLTITVFSKACGILPQTLRMWEKRYNAFNPMRSENGLRFYDENDLARAKRIVLLISKGYMISNLANLTLAELEALSPFEEQTLSVPGEVLKSVGIRKLHQHLESFNIEMLVLEMQYLRLSTGAKEFIFTIVLPIMREVGLLQARGKYSITQEHIVSTIVRDQLTKINLPNEAQGLSRFILATPEGNLHELALVIADTICKANRVPTCYLGAAHPADCLGEAINALKSQTVVLATLSSDQWDYGKNIISYLRSIDKLLNHKVHVILGGGWEIDFPKFQNIEKVTVLNSFEDFDRLTSQLT